MEEGARAGTNWNERPLVKVRVFLSSLQGSETHNILLNLKTGKREVVKLG